MADPERPLVRQWLARGLLLAGLWFTGAGLFDLSGQRDEGLDGLLAAAPGLGGGLLLLVAAWRLRAALRWDPPDER
ncbi:MAG: hypothetical protein ACK4Z0_02530 [Sphingomonadaceae bacterium]